MFQEVHKNFGFGCMRLPMKNGEVDEEDFKQMIDAFLDGDELKVVESSGRYEPRFKIVEIIEELREKTSPEN